MVGGGGGCWNRETPPAQHATKLKKGWPYHWFLCITPGIFKLTTSYAVSQNTQTIVATTESIGTIVSTNTATTNSTILDVSTQPENVVTTSNDIEATTESTSPDITTPFACAMPTFVSVGGRCYYLGNSEVLNWYNAESACRDLGSNWHLASMETAQVEATDNIVLCTIVVGADNDHAKSSCAPPNQYKPKLCTTKVYVGTELHGAWRRSVVHNTGRRCTT